MIKPKKGFTPAQKVENVKTVGQLLITTIANLPSLISLFMG